MTFLPTAVLSLVKTRGVSPTIIIPLNLWFIQLCLEMGLNPGSVLYHRGRQGLSHLILRE